MSDFELMRRKGDKRLVRVYSKDADNKHGYWHCAYECGANWSIASFTPDELEPIPKKHKLTVWVNVYDALGTGFLYASRESADKAGKRGNRIACLKFEREFEEGEGL